MEEKHSWRLPEPPSIFSSMSISRGQTRRYGRLPRYIDPILYFEQDLLMRSIDDIDPLQ